MRNNRKSRQKSLQVKLRNAGSNRAHFARAIQGFALDLHVSGAFEKVSLTADLRHDCPAVNIVLVPVRHGTAPIVETPDGEIHVEKIHLHGHFNIHAGSQHIMARALEMSVDEAQLKGWHPDHHEQAQKKVLLEVKYKHGRPVAKHLTQFLPKAERRMSATLPFNLPGERLTVSVIGKHAARHLIQEVIKRGLIKNNEIEEQIQRNIKDCAGTDAAAHINRRHRHSRVFAQTRLTGLSRKETRNRQFVHN